MVTSVFRAHPLRRLLRLKSLAAVPILATLGWTPPAAANEFTINACQADRANYSTQAFDDFATRGMASPKGGVGKTTTAFLVGNLLASHLKLRTIVVDATPGFGTLGRLPNDRARAARSLPELLEDADRIATAAELRPYVSRLPSGLHVLAAPTDALQPASLGPTSYGELVALLSCFYEAVLLDVGTGVTGQLARFALARADQVALVTAAEELTANLVIHALDHLQRPAAVVVNKAHPRAAAELLAIDECLALRGLHRSVPIPYDGRLATMLGSGTYSLEALNWRTRVAVKRLGLAVADRLV
jgi:MinD-like ATPase involved in chromosome partitioning or flagellar assembly